MQNLIEKLLKKRGIENTDSLTADEKETYDRWDSILSEGEITVKKISEFCAAQIKIIETQWKNMDNTKEKNERLIILHTVYSSLLEMMQAPKAERETLEKYLRGLLLQ